MLDVLGNVINTGDIVMCALGATSNRNNTQLTPCIVIEVTDKRCKITDCTDYIQYNNKYVHKAYSRSCWSKDRVYACWKRSHQIVKVENYIKKI